MTNLSDFKNLSISSECKDLSLITEGWSKDIKFKLTTNKDERRLIRLSEIGTYEKKSDHYKSLLPLKDKKLLISKALDFGTCEYIGKEYCFIIFTWIEGEMAEERLLSFSKKQQYEFGLQAGRILKEVHSIPIQSKYETMNWSQHFNKKLERNIKMSEECSIKHDGLDDIISYIESNRYLLDSRPIVFHHGDYHIGNMLINDQELGVIDFNRQDHGDPWEEFNRITWCASISPEFATGRINGYFENKVPEDFFKLLALYIASNQLSSVPWAIQFGQEQIDIMLNEASNVLDNYSNFKEYVPKWYLADQL